MIEYKELTLDCDVKILVSSDGKIYKEGIEWKINQYKTGYCYVTFKSSHHYLVHRLVASAFIQHLESGDRSVHVHHINGDKTDNRLENLQIVSMPEHQRMHKQRYAHEKKCVICGKMFTPSKSKRKIAQTCSKECMIKLMSKKAKSREIAQYSLDGTLIKKWESIRKAHNELGICEGGINMCCRGKYLSSGGYIWKYIS